MTATSHSHTPLQYLGCFARRFFSGSKIGLRNFTALGIRAAGLKRSLGFILQPVENWSRYPEFYAVQKSLPRTTAHDVILDIGSPKMFGILLTQRKSGQHKLTDIWPTAIAEFTNICALNLPNPNVSIAMYTADATCLKNIADSSVTLAYSISVLEHIPSDAKLQGIQLALHAIARVLKPGGTAVISVPVARVGRIEHKNEAVYAAGHGGAPVFFQNIYDKDEIVQSMSKVTSLSLVSADVIAWKLDWLPLKLWRKVPQTIRGALGFVNLLIAPWTFVLFPQKTDQLQIETDGDIVLVLQKI